MNIRFTLISSLGLAEGKVSSQARNCVLLCKLHVKVHTSHGGWELEVCFVLKHLFYPEKCPELKLSKIK